RDGEAIWLYIQYRADRGEDGGPLKIVGSVQDITERKKAQIASEASKKLFQAVVENNIDAIVLLDQNARVTFASPSAEMILGYSPADLIGKSALEHIHPDDVAEMRVVLEFVLREPGAASRKEYRARHSDGHWVWIEAIVKNSLAATTINAIVINYRDISERRRAEETVRAIQRGTATAAGEEFFRSLVLELSKSLQTRYAFVGRIRARDGSKVQTIAFSDRGSIVGNIEYELQGSASRAAIDQGFKFHPKDVRRACPDDQVVQRLQAESFLGVPLFSSKGHVLGILAVLDDRPMAGSSISTSFLKIFAARAGAELERLRSEERSAMLAQAVEGVSDCVSLTDLDENIILVNDAFLKTYGYEEHEIIGKPIEVLRSTKNDPRVIRSLLQSKMSGGWKGEIWNKRKDGTDFPIDLSTSVIRDEHGTLVAFAGIASDITERKKAEAELVKLRRAVEASSEVVFMTDPQGIMPYVNPAFTNVYGYSAAEVVGRVTPRILRAGHLDPKIYTGFWSTILNKQSVTWEIVNKTKSGKLITVDSSANPILDRSGNILGFLAIQRDITERILAEEAVRESEKRYRSLFQGNPHSMWVYDMETLAFLDVNDAAIDHYGYSRPEFLSMTIAEIRPPEDVPRLRESVLQRGDRFYAAGLWQHRRKDGRIIDVEIGSHAIDFAGKRATVVLATDVTERKQAEEAIRDKLQRLQLLRELGIVFARSLDLDALLRKVTEYIPKHMGVSRATVLLYSESHARLVNGILLPDEAGGHREAQLAQQPEDRISERCFVDRKAIIVNDCTATDLIPAEQVRGLKLRSSLAVPIISKEKNLGVMRVDDTERYHRFSEADIELFALVADQLAVVLDNAKLFSETKRAEEALRVSQDQLARIVETVPDGLVIVDADGRITFANPAAENILGLTHATITSRAYNDPAWKIRAVGGGRFSEEELPFTKVRQTRQPVFAVEHGIEYPDGRFRVLSINAAPLLEGNGEFSGMIASLIDITERREAQEALRESQYFNESVMAATPSMVYVLDLADKTIVYLNHTVGKVLGYKPEELIESGMIAWREAIHPDDVPLVDDMLHRWDTARDDDILAIEYRMRTKKGDWRWFLGRDKVLKRSADGSVRQIVGMATDITERKQAEEEIRRLNSELEQRVLERTAQLEAANKELEAFSYSVSHDLRAPLRHISGYVEILKKDASSNLDDESNRYLSTIAAAAVRLGGLIDDLLAFSRIGRAEITKVKVDLSEIVRETRLDLQTEIGDRHVQWNIGPLPKVYGDRLLLKLVVTNLLSNAIKFTQKKDSAVIEIGTSNGRTGYREMVFYVRDNGAGFDMKYVHKLFGVFQRLHTADDFEGTGIGLANVRRIIHRHGGRTWAEGSVEQGATFYFSLPDKP
ncbi:MAG TPA: hypothetical protein DCP63_07155, partial [Bacteroidetes bacterium]|nr:hypothetical protein [Bacteroidota bacterium]